MLTETENTLTIPDNIEEAEYPPEVVERWDREFEVLEAQVAIGELRPMSIAEIIDRVGVI